MPASDFASHRHRPDDVVDRRGLRVAAGVVVAEVARGIGRRHVDDRAVRGDQLQGSRLLG